MSDQETKETSETGENVGSAENVKAPPGVPDGHYEEPRESQDPDHRDAGQVALEREKELLDDDARAQREKRERETGGKR